MTAANSTIDNRQSTIASLRDAPSTSTKLQHQTLVIAASKKGIDLPELRRMVGGSLCRLSAAECSAWIERLSGRGLPHPPGCAPPAYPRRRSPSPSGRGRGEGRATAVSAVRPNPRMITSSHVSQIGNLMVAYFENNPAAAHAWFKKNFKCDNPMQLGTTERAGQVIAVLRRMLTRKEGTP